MFVRRCAFSFALVSLVALAACGGHAAGVLPQSASALQEAAPDFGPGAEEPDAAAIAVTFTFLTAPNPEPDGAGSMHQHFIAWSTKSVQIQVYKPNSAHVAKNLLSTVIVKIGAGTSGCKPSAGNTRTCTAKLRLPPPSVDLVMTSWDRAPVGGKIPTTAKQLAFGSTSGTVVKAGATVKVALGGIPTGFVLTVPGSTIVNGAQQVSMHGVAPANQKMNLVALDADGNIILTDGYVTAKGKPASIAMTVKPSLASCGSAALSSGTGMPGTAIKVSAPPKGGVVFQYGATAVATPFTTAGACSFLVRATFAGAAPQAGRYVLLGPQITEYPISGSTIQPVAITRGPDGNMWWTDFTFVGTINVSTKAMTQYPFPNTPQGIVSGPDGNLWITSYGKVSRMSTSGSVLDAYGWGPPPYFSDQPSPQLAVGPDGNFWFADVTSANSARQLVKMTPSGTATGYTPAKAGDYLMGVAAGADQRMWFGEFDAMGTSYMERITTSGTNSALYSLTQSAAQIPNFAIQGPDGNVWFTSCSGRSINKITTAGVTTSFQPASLPQSSGLTTGPDGAIWFGSLTGGSGALLRIPTNATSGSQITSFPVTKGGGVYWVATGPDGALWFTEWLNNNNGTTPPKPSPGWIGRMTY